jgi:hypothetical protein
VEPDFVAVIVVAAVISTWQILPSLFVNDKMFVVQSMLKNDTPVNTPAVIVIAGPTFAVAVTVALISIPLIR